jgi:hypothetical protein
LAADGVVAAYESNPFSLPTFHASIVLMSCFGDRAVSRAPGSQGDHKLRSSPADIHHAQVGGVYCDAFSCDAEMAVWIAPLRRGLGLPEAITHRAVKSDGAAFVAELDRLCARRNG